MEQTYKIKNAETWKVIEEFPNYEISSWGKVRNIKTGRILKLGHARGYLRAQLCNNGYYKIFSVHRLVAKYFCKKKNGCEFIDHINGNKHDNYYENLRWCTNSENLRNAKNNKITLMINKNTNEVIKEFSCITEAADYILNLNNNNSTLKSVISGINKCAHHRYNRVSAYGYKWEFKDSFRDYSDKAKKDYLEQCEELINKKEIK